MKFSLDSALISDIIFHMENQENKFVYDTLKSEITLDLNKEFGDNYIPLPEWTPADGFRLMQKFTNNLKNPILRQELTDALNANKGVFRAFKNILERHPHAEKIFNSYKNHKMKAEVISWYNALREEWGLEPIGDEPEDNSHLVLEDFVIKEKKSPDSELSFIAETEDGQEAGIIKASKDSNGFHIYDLFVQEQYRGMGLGKTLLAKFLEKAGSMPVKIDVPKACGFFSRTLLLEGFKPESQRFVRK